MQLVLLALQKMEEAPNPAETAVTIANAIDDRFLLFGVEFIPGHVQRNFGQAREAFKLREQRPVFWLGPGFDRAFIQGLAFVGNDQVEIEIDGVAEALATRAGAIRIVERKQPWLRLFIK